MEIIPAAAGERTGKVSFAEGGDTTSGHVGEGALTVRLVDLDSFCAERKLQPSVLKIDV